MYPLQKKKKIPNSAENPEPKSECSGIMTLLELALIKSSSIYSKGRKEKAWSDEGFLWQVLQTFQNVSALGQLRDLVFMDLWIY